MYYSQKKVSDALAFRKAPNARELSGSLYLGCVCVCVCGSGGGGWKQKEAIAHFSSL